MGLQNLRRNRQWEPLSQAAATLAGVDGSRCWLALSLVPPQWPDHLHATLVLT